MRVLLFCPLNPNPPKLWRRTMESILKMQWEQPIDYLLSANDNPAEQKYLNIANQYNKARQYVLDGGYDALLCVESDMVVPHDALTRLVALDSDIAYALYVFRHTRHNWSAYTELAGVRGVSISENKEAARKAWGTMRDVAGVGLGCTLIKKHVLQKISFRLMENAPDKTACDWTFAIDAQANKFRQRCDLGAVCGHLSYKPYPMILWPDPEADKLYRRESLPGVKMKEVKPGDQFNVGAGETMLFKAKS